MTRRLFLLALAAIALLGAACGDDSSSPSTPSSSPTPMASAHETPAATNGGIVPPSLEPTETISYATAATDNERVVAVLESGYTADVGEINGVVILHNRNRTEAVAIDYRVTPVYGGTEGEPFIQRVVLLPDETIGDAYTVTYPADQQSATPKITVLLPDARWSPFASAERIEVTPAYNFRPEGTVTNPFDGETGPLRLTLVLRDEGGGFVEALSTELASIPAHSRSEFAIPDAERFRQFQPYVSFDNDFPSWMTAQ